MKIEPGMIVNDKDIYKSGEKLKITTDNNEVHTGVFLRAHPNELTPDIMTLRMKGFDKQKYAVNGNRIKKIERWKND